jgi:hypothetical protein
MKLTKFIDAIIAKLWDFDSASGTFRLWQLRWAAGSFRRWSSGRHSN